MAIGICRAGQAAKAGTNFTDKRRSLSQYSSLADPGNGVWDVCSTAWSWKSCYFSIYCDFSAIYCIYPNIRCFFFSFFGISEDEVHLSPTLRQHHALISMFMLPVILRRLCF
jgi:hypothetical protein